MKMKLTAHVDGTSRSIELQRDTDGALEVRLDGKSFAVDAVETAPGAYSILIAGCSFEARVQPSNQGIAVHCAGSDFLVQIDDPRAWRKGCGGAIEAEGRQQVMAPMPGKVVRVLVAAGETVEAGQGLVVVEAMKMQNEIRAPKSGVVERVFVGEGQAVGAGDPLAIVA
jgi:biotin carboxyl carrier protein